MKKKEASARIKINHLLEEAGWRFFDDENGPANIQLEPNVKMSKADLTGLGENFDKVEEATRRIIAEDKRILSDPAPFVALHALDASSVNVIIRAWVKSEDYWGVYFDMNKTIYSVFNKEGIGFPFPQLTVHQAKD